MSELLIALLVGVPLGLGVAMVMHRVMLGTWR